MEFCGTRLCHVGSTSGAATTFGIKERRSFARKRDVLMPPGGRRLKGSTVGDLVVERMPPLFFPNAKALTTQRALRELAGDLLFVEGEQSLSSCIAPRRDAIIAA